MNISTIAGGALLFKNNSDKNILPGESNEVVDYFDKNIKTNIHLGFGIIFGWAF